MRKYPDHPLSIVFKSLQRMFDRKSFTKCCGNCTEWRQTRAIRATADRTTGSITGFWCGACDPYALGVSTAEGIVRIFAEAVSYICGSALSRPEVQTKADNHPRAGGRERVCQAAC